MAKQKPAPWLDVMRGWAANGVAEVPGKENNKKISAMWTKIGWEGRTEAWSWCAAGVGASLVECGYEIPPKEVNSMARSYLAYGTKLDKPVVGAIAVLPRGKPPSGHVCLIDKVHADGSFDVIGCNQSNAVTYMHNLTMKDVIGLRWPPEKMSITKTIVRSLPISSPSTRVNSSWLGLGLIGTTIMEGWSWLLSQIGWLVDQLPGMTGQAAAVISSNEQIFSWLGIPWGKLGFGSAALVLCYIIWRTATKEQPK